MNLYERYPSLSACREDIEKALALIIETYKKGGKLLLCGNGGSEADCDHIVGELMKGFRSLRPDDGSLLAKLKAADIADAEHMASKLQGALPAVSLCSQNAFLTAFANDVDADLIYAQALYGLGKPQDLLICLSTSGNSKNVVHAAELARALGIHTLALTGERESKLSALCDITVKAPACETYQVQELHLPVYHYLCAKTEEAFFA